MKYQVKYRGADLMRTGLVASSKWKTKSDQYHILYDFEHHRCSEPHLKPQFGHNEDPYDKWQYSATTIMQRAITSDGNLS